MSGLNLFPKKEIAVTFSLIVPLLLGLLVFTVPAVGAESCLECHDDFSGAVSPHQPVADGECLYCHAPVQLEHPAEQGVSFELVEQGAELCLLCHDAVNEQRVVHFPVEEGECLSCHNVHGSEQPKLLSVGNNQKELCLECHDSYSFEMAFRHGPAAVGACTSCHNPHASDHEALLEAPIRDNCLACHDDFAAQMQTASMIHPPVVDSPCTDCHNPHSSDTRFNLKKKMPDLCFDCHEEIGEAATQSAIKHQPMEDAGSCGNCHSTHFSRESALLAIPEETLCLNCHGADSSLTDIEKQLAGEKTLHGPIQAGECAGCHNPHGSDVSRLLRRNYPQGRYFPYQEGAYDLCLQCHEENMLRFPDTTLYTEFRNGDRNLHFVHVADPRKGRTCRLCHAAHASEGEKLISRSGTPFGTWKVPIGFQGTSTGGSCAPGCHQELSYDRENPVENQFIAPKD